MKRLGEFESKTKEERDRLKKDLERLNRENEVLRKREGEWKEGIVKYKQELDAELQTTHDLLRKEKEELQLGTSSLPLAVFFSWVKPLQLHALQFRARDACREGRPGRTRGEGKG